MRKGDDVCVCKGERRVDQIGETRCGKGSAEGLREGCKSVDGGLWRRKGHEIDDGKGGITRHYGIAVWLFDRR